MNYAGKFDAAIFLDGQGPLSPAALHVDSFATKSFTTTAHGHVPDGAFVVPDPNMVFHGEYKRAGADLVLSHDGHEFVVHDYFRGEKRAAISSPDGAHLTGDIVNALTGHVEYAQAAAGVAAAQVIGHVTKLNGSATAVRNGVSIILNNGDNVEKGDVVSTGGDTTLGITFIDGTVFGLSSNARMVLNEMVYDPNGSNNSSLLSLVAGTITFVAGETAKHGDMKIDTPVATMGIRGTAVLNQINFVVPAGGGDPQPQVSFQVLVEPNGTTGSYILFDKVTLLPIATVNQAGQMIQISGGNVSISNALMSPDVQKLITDVFTLKFTDNGTNTKLTTNFTDTITQNGNVVFIKTDTGANATATFTNQNQPGTQGSGNDPSTGTRFPGSPHSGSFDSSGNATTAFALTEHANATGDRADTTGDTVPSDTISGIIRFVDQNLGDRPTVSVDLAGAPNYVYMDYINGVHHDVTGSLTALQKQDIAATLIKINVVAAGGNDNNGSAVWTYKIPDHVFDFLAAGETLTLTYMVSIDNNFSVSPETATIPITITITGTNDKPVITTSVPTITFSGGTSVPGGPLTSDVPTSGTLIFKDVDLTDTHTVSVALTSASLPDSTLPPGPLAVFESAMSVAIANGSDSTGTGTGTINWSLADLPVYLADFIPKGEVLTLVYTVTVKDEHGATSQQTITVTITGTDAAAVVWIATNKDGAPAGGFWKDAANWETGTVPTITDDVIVITDQLHGLTPSYPVTIDAAAYANSITMNDFGGPPPDVINKSSLTIAGALNMSADSIFNNTATGLMSVGGKAEILGTSVLTNAGWLTLAGGGDFAKGTTITNSGTIELSGGTLTTLATIHNAGGKLRADAGSTLIVDTATLDGGTVTIAGTLELDGTSLIANGALNSAGTVNVSGTAEFAHETVSNTTSATIKVLANGWLTIDQGSSVTNNGAVTVDASGKLTVNGASIIGTGTVTNNGEIDLTGDAVLSGGTLTNNATFKIGSTGNALDSETVTNTCTIEVLANAALTMSGATISGGAVNGGGIIDVTGASKIDGGATLSVAAVTADAMLTLDGVTVSGTDITDKSSVELDHTVQLKDGAKIQGASAASKGAITNKGTLEIAGAATLLNDVLANTGHIIKIDDGQTLTLSGTEIIGGAINNYNGPVGGTIDVTGNSKIDGYATLNKGAVTVESGVTLTLDDATVAGTEIANHGTVQVDAAKKLTLNGASLTGGTLSVSGTLDSTGTTTITYANISNSYLIEATLGVLTLLAMTPAAAITNNDTIRANGAELDINGEAVTNTGALAAINDGTLKLIGMTVTNTGGTVSVESGSTLDLAGATINGGTLTIAGTLESTGASAINDGDITNTGTITVTSDTLTIDPAVLHTITNHHLVQAKGGELDISGDLIVNTADIKAISHGTLKLTTVTVTNGGGTITVDGTSKLYLSDVTVDGGSLSNAGNLYGVSGSNTISAGVTNTGTIEVEAGTLNLSGGLSGVGSVIIDDGATLELAGATAQTITFAGGADTLQLDKVVGQSFTGTIASQSSNGGTFTVTGAADITTSSGDALDFIASGGTLAKPADIALMPTGTLIGAANGIVVVQNGVGDISLTTVGDVAGSAGDGVVLQDGATGRGDITATIGGAVSGAVGLDVLANGNGAVTITNNGHITGATSFGISVVQDGTGATGSTHITNTGSIVGADGVAAISIHENTTGTALIDNSGTIGPGDAGSVVSTTYAIFETGGAITINNGGDINGNISVATSTFNNEAAGTWTVSGTSVFGNLSSIVSDGVIDLLDGASISGTGLSISNSNEIDSWGTTSISGTITNTGTIDVNGGTLTLFGSLSGSGSVTIDTGATLDVGGTVTQTITFSGGGGELEIDTSSFGGSVSGFAATDKLDLSTIKCDGGTSLTYDAKSGDLFVSDAYGHSITVKLTGADYSNAHFASSSDGHGGTLITLNANDDAPSVVAESNPAAQTVILSKSAVVLAPGVTTNALGLHIESFETVAPGSTLNNGAHHGDFTSTDLDATFAGARNAGVVQDSVSGVTAAPFFGPNSGQVDTTHYLSVGAGSSETITFNHEQNAFGLYWGSVDFTNRISFYEGTKLVATYSGSDIAPLIPSGNLESFASNGYVQFKDLPPFDKVVLASGTNALEADNVSSGYIADSHNQLAAPVGGTLTVRDADIGDTLTAIVTNDAVATYNGSTHLPTGLDLSALTNSGAITFDSVTSNGGSQDLHWTYDPTNANFDFLEPGDSLSITFNAHVTDRQVSTGDQALTITILGTAAAPVVGTAGNDIFVNVGGGVTILGRGGSDTFQFKPGFGSAKIGDFNVNEDLINIDKSLFTSVDAILASARSANSGHDTVISDAAHDQITLAGVTVGQLKVQDFHLV